MIDAGPAGGSPEYLRIADSLERGIRRGRWRAGARLPPERALARSFGVSYMTFRHAAAVLTQRGLIAREHGSGTFVRPLPVRRPAAGAVMVVGRYGESRAYLQDPLGARLLRGVEQELARKGRDLVLRMQRGQPLAALVDSVPVAGLLLTYYDARLRADARELVRRHAPFVLMGKSPHDRALSFVDADKAAGGRLAADWLLRQGCRRLVYAVTARRLTVRQRIAGMRAALAAAGHPAAALRVALLPAESAAAQRALRACLEEFRPDGLIPQLPGGLMPMALAAWRAAAERRGRAPCVAGFDHDAEILARSGLPAAYVAHPFEEIGRRAAALLLRRIEGRAAGVEQQLLPVRLVECAPRPDPRSGNRRAGARLPHLESRPPPVGARPRRAIPFHPAVAGGSTGLHGNPGVGRMPRRGGHAPRGG